MSDIDTTGLVPEAVVAVEVLVHVLRGDARRGIVFQSRYWPGGLPDEATKAWIESFRVWSENHPVWETLIDDDRETIYAGRGE